MPGRARATDTDKVVAAAEAEAKAVTVVSPDGSHREVVSNPTYLNSLVYGMGYKVEGGMSTSEAVATVTDPSAATGEPKD